MIKKTLSGLFVASIIFASCVKSNNKCNYSDSNVTAPDSEVQNLKDSLFSHNITDATLNPIGFYYKIDSVKSGTSVTNLCSNISVSYKGTYFDGVSFDSTAANQVATFQLGQVIVGWQKGIPLINKGGVISLYIPPTLAYGPNPLKDNAGNVLVPGNSYLVFKVRVLDIQ